MADGWDIAQPPSLARLGEGAATASTGGPTAAVTPLGSALWQAIDQGAASAGRIPMELAKSAWSGFTAPGDAFSGKLEPNSEEGRRRIDELAGLVIMGGIGGAPVRAGEAVLGAGPIRQLPMDEASRMARAKAMGYSDDVFWRGEASGKLPNEYPSGAHFSRDRDYAAGFAQRGGQAEPREFRLDLNNTYRLGGEMTAGQYGRLVESAMAHDPQLARQLADQFERTPQWMVEFGKRNPHHPVMDGGATTLTHDLIAKSRAPESVFKGAGFNAIDSGRDVRNLDGFGIRSAQAAFDPAKADRQGILLSLGALAPGIFGLASRPDPNSDQR